MNIDDNGLCCPACGQELVASTGKVNEGRVKETNLACSKCFKEYSMLRGIARFVDNDAYAGNFSLEWGIHRKTQLDTATRKISKDNFMLKFGLPEAFFKGKRILDAGVGMGRYAQVALEAGAKVWGIDLSYAVDIAKQNLSEYKDVHFAQADIFNLPFKENYFDVIYCFGVLHHTPAPQEAFRSLLRHLKPGGLICISVYPKSSIYYTSRYLRKITVKIPKRLLYFFTTAMTLILYVPYRYLGLRYGILGRFAPISLSDSLAEAILDTYDCYSPKYQFTYFCHEVFQWFKQAGLHDIEVRPQSITMSGYK